MAQIFKTISLEERLRASTYNELPQKPQPVNQGEGSMKIPTPPLQSQPAQLKITIDAQEKNSAILKEIAKTAGVQLLPNVGTFETAGLNRFNVPLANTKFRTTINLADRLSQPQIGTTRHLPQFFLADFYTDYITITRFGIFNHTSNIIVLPAGATPDQGSVNLINITFIPNHTSNIQPPTPLGNFILRQGGVFSNGVYRSIIPITLTPEDFILQQGGVLSGGILQSITTITLTPGNFILRQGGVFSNGTYRSLINVSFPIPDLILQQGVFVSNGLYQSFTDPTDPTAVGFVLQGLGISPTQAISTQSVYPLQGLVILQNTLQSSITPTTPIASTNQGGLDPTPITFEPDRSSPILRVLFYAAQRALAFFSPRVVHGSADLRNENFAERNLYYGSTIDVEGLLSSVDGRRFISPDLRVYARKLSVDFGTSNSLLVGRVPALDYTYDTVGEDASTENVGLYPNYRSERFQKNTAGLALNTTAEIDTLITLRDEVIKLHTTEEYDPNRLPGATFPSNKSSETGLGFPAYKSYRTLAYDELADRADLFCVGLNQPDFRAELNAAIPDIKGGDGNLVGENGMGSKPVAYSSLGQANYGTGFNYQSEVVEGKSPLDIFRGNSSGIFQTLGYKELQVRANNGVQNVLQRDFRAFRGNDVIQPLTGAGRRPLSDLGIDEDDTVAYQLIGQGSYGGGRLFPELSSGEGRNGNYGKYKTLSYTEIQEAEKDPTKRYAAVKTAVSKSISTTDGGVSTNEVVTLSIGGVSFRAFISSFSDGFTVSWSDIKYVGRQDTLKAFQGVTRGGSLAFKVAAFNATDLRSQYTKLNNLVNSVAVGKTSGGTRQLVTGPFTTLTVGKWFSGTPIVVNSLKFDVQVTEYSWDYNNKVPHIIDVSLDFAVLGDVLGKKLSGKNSHFAY